MRVDARGKTRARLSDAQPISAATAIGLATIHGDRRGLDAQAARCHSRARFGRYRWNARARVGIEMTIGTRIFTWLKGELVGTDTFGGAELRLLRFRKLRTGSGRRDARPVPRSRSRIAMNRNAIETIMGAVVLVVAAVFLFFAYTTTQVNGGGGSEYVAQFDRVDGL